MLLGKSATGETRSSEAGAYPRHMAITYASAVRSARLRGAQATPRPNMPMLTLKTLLDNIAYDPAHSVQRPLQVGGGSDSASGNVPVEPVVPGEPCGAPGADGVAEGPGGPCGPSETLATPTVPPVAATESKPKYD